MSALVGVKIADTNILIDDGPVANGMRPVACFIRREKLWL